MTISEAIILGLVQGLTEFIPVSSSGHLIIVPYLFGWETHHPSFDIFVHLGTLLSLIIFYRQKLINITKGALSTRMSSSSLRASLVTKIALATLPAIFFGMLFKNTIDASASSIPVAIFALISVGILFVIIDTFMTPGKRLIDNLSLRGSLIIGIIEIFAFVRGASRSGVTILGGLSQKLSYKEATEFSFLIGIPVILAAVAYQILFDYESVLNSGIEWHIYAIGLVTSFISGYAAIKFMTELISKIGLKWFGVYRIILGVVLIFLVW